MSVFMPIVDTNENTDDTEARPNICSGIFEYSDQQDLTLRIYLHKPMYGNTCNNSRTLVTAFVTNNKRLLASVSPDVCYTA